MELLRRYILKPVSMAVLSIAILTVILQPTPSYGQQVAVGGSINYLSSGMYLTYRLPSRSRWTMDAGVSVMINTYALNENRQNFIYYRNGYAANLWQHFGLLVRPQFRIFEYRQVGLNAIGNMLLSCHALKYKKHRWPSTEVYFKKAAPSIEATIGLNAYWNISKRVQVSGGIGYGIALLHYSQYGVNLTTGEPVTTIRMGRRGYQGRWDIEYVGLDGMPMLTVGLAYGFK